MPINFDNVQITGGLTFIPEILTPTGDPYWANVSLLMNNTTTNNQTNNTFLDSSTNNFMITRTGTVTQGSITPYTVSANTSYSTNVNGGSGYFPGSDDYLSIANNIALTMGTGNFTLEAWVYPLTAIAAGMAIVDTRTTSTNGFIVHTIGTTNKLRFTSNNTLVIESAETITTSQWNHVALVRSSNVVRIYVNGLSSNSASYSSAVNAAGFRVGSPLAANSSVGDFNGYITDVRMVKGDAVYTANFTPPTTPLTNITNTSVLMNFTNAGIFDGATKNNLITLGDAKVSTTQAKFGTTSVSFDGTGDYITIPANSLLDLSSGNFTVEFWFNTNTVVPSTQGLLSRFNGNALDRTGIQYGFFLNQTSLTITPYSSTTNYDMTFSNSIAAGTWYHVALVRTGNTFYAYLNGQQNTTVRTISGSLNNNAAWSTWIGRYVEGGSTKDFNGYLQDIRITKGIARYTANFTPPTTAFPTY